MESEFGAQFSSLQKNSFSNPGGYSSCWFLTPGWNCPFSVPFSILRPCKSLNSKYHRFFWEKSGCLAFFFPQGSPVRAQTPQQFENNSSSTALMVCVARQEWSCYVVISTLLVEPQKKSFQFTDRFTSPCRCVFPINENYGTWIV